MHARYGEHYRVHEAELDCQFSRCFILVQLLPACALWIGYTFNRLRTYGIRWFVTRVLK